VTSGSMISVSAGSIAR